MIRKALGWYVVKNGVHDAKTHNFAMQYHTIRYFVLFILLDCQCYLYFRLKLETPYAQICVAILNMLHFPFRAFIDITICL